VRSKIIIGIIVMTALCCMLFVQKEKELDGIFQIHPEGPLVMSLWVDKIAFLIDRERGLCVSLDSSLQFYNLPIVGEYHLVSWSSDPLKAHCVGSIGALTLFQVEESDRKKLQAHKEYKLSDQWGTLHQKVSFLSDLHSQTSTNVMLGDVMSSARLLPMTAAYTARKDAEPSLNVPVVGENGAVIGVRFDRKSDHSLYIAASPPIVFQCDYFKKQGVFFTAHIGALLSHKSMEEFSEFMGLPIVWPEGYDSSMVHKRPLTVSECNASDHLQNMPFAVRDHIFFVEGEPVYRITDVWRVLEKAIAKGKKTVSVRIWRMGKMMTVEAPICFLDTFTPDRVIDYGSHIFFETSHVFRRHGRRLACMSKKGNNYNPKAFVYAMNGKEVHSLDDVYTLLSECSKEGVVLSTEPINIEWRSWVYAPRMVLRFCPYHKKMTEYKQSFDSKWVCCA